MAVLVKTLNGLAYASVKARNGLAVASIKTIDGLDVTAGGFTPGDLPSLEMWLAADSLSLSNGDPVSTWTDLSPANRDATQFGAARPGFFISQINSLPAVLFDGLVDFLNFSTYTAADFDLFAVINQTGDNIWMGRDADAETQIRIGQTDNTLSTYDGANNPVSSTLAVTEGNWALVRYTRIGSTVTFRQNGISYGSGTMSGTRYFNMLGAIWTAGGTVGYLNGSLAEVVLVGTELTTQQGEDTEDYLGSKYDLPITH